MKKHRILLSTALLVLSLGVLTPQFAQGPSSDDEKAEQQKHHALCIALVRIISTNEVAEMSRYGSFVSWENLLAHQPQYFDRWLAKSDSQQARFADAPDILPSMRRPVSVKYVFLFFFSCKDVLFFSFSL
jgi:hypothetical protein